MKPLGCLIFALLLAFTPPLPGGEATLSREEAFSYFLLNCAYFGRWPASLDIHQTGKLRLGILGDDPLGAALDDVADRACHSWFRSGRVEIRRTHRIADLADAHIIFITADNPPLEAEVLRTFTQRPVLLISSAPGFASRGGTIETRIEQERLVFELNLHALRTSGVELDSKMKIRAARIIRAAREEHP